jgi:hypothetical protein
VAVVAANKLIFVVITTAAKPKYDPGNLQGVAENHGKG